MAAASARAGVAFSSYADLHRWSIDDREGFWSLVWDFCGVVGEKGERVLVDGDRMPGASFFPDARLNFAENLLQQDRRRPTRIVFRGEDKVERRLSWDELRALVSRLQQLFVSLGVKQGDRIAAMMPNMPETVAAMLAAASLGAVWSSCSPDFGEQGVLDRFGQIEPVAVHRAATATGTTASRTTWPPRSQAVAGQAADASGRRSSSTISAQPRQAVTAIAARGRRSTMRSRLSQPRNRHVRAAALLASALHPVLVGHHRHSEMHRPFGRRHAAPASQGAAPACRHRRGRPPLLFHHLRLDDVELAGLRPGLRRDAAALRRLALPSRTAMCCSTSPTPRR